jgi:hypothetical protein
MQLKIQPRLQLETWSLYWKASTRTHTQCLDAFTLDLNGATSCTVARMMDQVRCNIRHGSRQWNNCSDNTEQNLF